MKKLLTLVVVLALGVFVAVGCDTKKSDKKGGAPAPAATKTEPAKDAPKGDVPAPAPAPTPEKK